MGYSNKQILLPYSINGIEETEVHNRKKISAVDSAVLLVIYLCVCVSYITEIPLGVIAILAYGLFCHVDKMYRPLPLILFFYSFLQVPFINVSVFIPYSIIFIVKSALSKSISISFSAFLFIVVNAAYCLMVVFPESLVKACTGMLGVVFCLFFSKFLRESPSMRIDFFKHYGVATVLAGVLSLIFGADEVDHMTVNGVITQFVRYKSTFSDPNYAGLFYTIGLWAVVILKPFKNNKINTALICAMLILLLITCSVTALLILVLTCVIYALIERNSFLFKRMAIVAAIVLVLVVLFYIAGAYDVPYLSDFRVRVIEKLSQATQGDINDVTTNRWALFLTSLDYYFTADWVTVLFGGVCSNAIINTTDLLIHNEYMTLLLNIGLIGTVIYACYLFKHIKLSITKKDTFGIVCKTIMLMYAATLAMYMDFRFLMAFLF